MRGLFNAVLALGRQLGLVRSVAGFRADFPLDARWCPTGGCAKCGAPATSHRAPPKVLSLVGRPVAEVSIPLCDLCAAEVRRRLLWQWGLTLAVLASGSLTCLLVAYFWEWAPFWVLVVSCGLVAALAWMMGGLLGRGPRASWLGVPALWGVSHQKGVATLCVVGNRLGQALQVLGNPVERVVLQQRDGAVALLGAVLVTLSVPPVVWWRAHPPLRVVNVSERSLEILVDGRSLGLVTGVPGEAPNGGRALRLPWGWRVLESRGLDGTVLDRTTAWLGRGAEQIYAPAHGDRCFWVEQRSYGRSDLSRSGTMVLRKGATFFTLPYQVDAWFHPNPAPGSRDRWFSGGVRRALRQGPCDEAPATKSQ